MDTGCSRTEALNPITCIGKQESVKKINGEMLRMRLRVTTGQMWNRASRITVTETGKNDLINIDEITVEKGREREKERENICHYWT